MRILIFGVVMLFAVSLFAVSLYAAELRPVDVEQAFVEPETEATFRFVAESGGPESTEFRVLDAWGEPIQTVQAVRDGEAMVLTATLSRGFWELEYPASGQRFGVVALPAFRGKPDPYFAIDGAFSWLVREDAMREGLVKVAKRSGIGMIRERLRWNAVEPREGSFDWETKDRYDKLRAVCQANGVAVLELFHDAPAWVGTIEKYPDDLVKTARSWETIAKRWSPTWGALEIWNEPEIFFGGELPADQYVPMVKAITYQLKKAGITTPIFGGVMAHFEKDWLDTAAENGLLDAVDGFSFHTYDRAPSMARIAGEYRDWLAKHGKGSLPLWLTECGRPWKKGPKRPEIAEDWTSAVDITMKGVESRCCGVDRYFPFVYPYYEENDNNFGMMDRLGTPTRSFAAYVQLIRMLAGTVYTGGWKIDEPEILRARTFYRPENETVLVLCTGKLETPTSWPLPGNVRGVESATGEPIAVGPDGTIPLASENLVYVVLDSERRPESGLSTAADAIAVKTPSPIVLRYQFDKERVLARPQGYTLKRTDEKPLPIAIRVFNLADQSETISLRFTASNLPVETKPVSVPGEGFADVVWELPPSVPEWARGEPLKVRIDTDKGETLVLSFKGEATWDGLLSTVGNITEILVGEMGRWVKNAPPICTSNFEKPGAGEQAVWRMFASFGEGDRWTFPKFELPPTIDLAKGDGLLVWARCIGEAKPSLMLFESNGVGYFVAPIIKNDGEWHAVKLPFERFVHVGATGSDPNGKLDLDQVRSFSFGANSQGPNCVLELKKIALYQ